MFYKKIFSDILKKIYKTYPNQRAFADAAGVNRAYLSQYINLKLDNPPTPKILMGIANASNGLSSYYELMEICGYVNTDTNFHKVTNSLAHPSNFFTAPILKFENGKLCETEEDVILPNNIDNSKQYFGFRAIDESMSPLFGIGDIAIIEKTNEYVKGKTYLLQLDNSTILVRKIIEIDNGIELHSMNPYFPIIKLTTEELKSRNFKILGRMIKSENESAFK